MHARHAQVQVFTLTLSPYSSRPCCLPAAPSADSLTGCLRPLLSSHGLSITEGSLTLLQRNGVT